MGANVVASLPVACKNAAGDCFSSCGGSLCQDPVVPSKKQIIASMSSASSASSASSVSAASSASSVSEASVASVAATATSDTPTPTSTSASPAASSAVVQPIIVQRVPLDPDYPLTFLAGTTFNFGAGAVVAGNIALGAPAAAYAGTGIGALTLDSSKQFCKFFFSFFLFFSLFFSCLLT